MTDRFYVIKRPLLRSIWAVKLTPDGELLLLDTTDIEESWVDYGDEYDLKRMKRWKDDYWVSKKMPKQDAIDMVNKGYTDPPYVADIIYDIRKNML